MNAELKDFIDSIISYIDYTNEATEGKADTSNLFNQLIGVKIALHTMGVKINFDINPFYFRDKIKSGYTLAFAE